MPLMYTYALPVKSRPTKASLVSGKKRKRSEASDSEDGADSDASVEGQDAADPSFNWASLTTATTEEYRTAGFDPTRDHVPSAPFPHKAVIIKSGRDGSYAVDDETVVSSTKSISSLHGVSAYQENHKDQTLRSQHLANLTTLLHRCMATGDFVRAEKAWALILRSGGESIELKESVMDIRRSGKWAIAAEILLQRWKNIDNSAHSSGGVTNPTDIHGAEAQLDLDNVRAARRFYERLALQYPASKFRAEQPTDFYLHLYGLWIYEISERTRRAMLQVRRTDNSDGEGSDFDEDASGDASDDGANLNRAATTQIRSQEFQDARDLVNNLDDVLTRPPFDKSPDLLHLRGMASLWIVDLMQELTQVNSAGISPDAQRQDQLRICKEERDKAQSFFIRCMANGGRVAQHIIDDFSSRKTLPVLPSNAG